MIRINRDRLMHAIATMAEIGATPGGEVTRLALTDEDRAARDLLRSWMVDAGLTVRFDDLGNMVDRRAGQRDLPAVLIGSHLDTVPQGGRYDGALGVLAALEVIRTLNDARIATAHPVEMVNWTAEEGSRFRPPLFGSGAALGWRDASIARATTDTHGNRFGDELARSGYAGDAANRPADARAYLELHIEQGPVLENEGLPVGVVEGIIGQTWFDVVVSGRAGHAGASPMEGRADALVAASALVLAVRRLAAARAEYSVATVGKLTVEPGAMNVVPGRVRFTIDVRCARMHDMATIANGIRDVASIIEADEGVRIEIAGGGDAEPQPFDAGVIAVIRQAVRARHLPVRQLWSGAGHDAGAASRRWPTGMIFVRSKDGLSHAEAEYSSPEDIEAATNVLLDTVVTLAG